MKIRPEPGSALIIGAGVFGASAALELVRRGVDVTMLDPGPVPTPQASSTDISKVVRMDYGADEFYTGLVERALEGWDAWNQLWPRPLFHKVGFLLLSREQMKPGSFEYESYRVLQGRGHRLLRIDQDELAQRHPRWGDAGFADGYFNPTGGWVESGQVVAWLVRQAQIAGARLLEGTRVRQLLRSGDRVWGVRMEDGGRFEAQVVVLAAGAWTPGLLSESEGLFWPVAQPVLHFRVLDVPRYQPPEFTPWAADISTAGWYGFPASADGTLKVANHGRGWHIDPAEAGEVPAEVEGRFRAFLEEALPELAGLPLIGGRLCFYCDTWDGDFFIDRVPGVEGLVVASGGSGHAFKFAPLMGELIADAALGRENPMGARFAWRTRGVLRREEARSLNDF